MVRRVEWGNEEEDEEGGGVAIRAEEKGDEGGEFAAAEMVPPPTVDIIKPADRQRHTHSLSFLRFNLPSSPPVADELLDGGATLREASPSAAVDNMDPVVAGGNQDMIPTPEGKMLASAEVRWGAGEGGIPGAASRGLAQCWEVREGEGGTGGVPICFCCPALGEKGAG